MKKTLLGSLLVLISFFGIGQAPEARSAADEEAKWRVETYFQARQ